MLVIKHECLKAIMNWFWALYDHSLFSSYHKDPLQSMKFNIWTNCIHLKKVPLSKHCRRSYEMSYLPGWTIKLSNSWSFYIRKWIKSFVQISGRVTNKRALNVNYLKEAIPIITAIPSIIILSSNNGGQMFTWRHTAYEESNLESSVWKFDKISFMNQYLQQWKVQTYRN